MLDSLGTIIATILGQRASWSRPGWDRQAYTRIKADRDRIAANQAAIDAASKRLLDARRKADIHQAVLDAQRRDEFEKQP